MNRRRFLRQAIVGGGLAAGAGSLLFVRRHYARADLKSRLINDTLAPLATIANGQLQTLPVRAGEEIKRFFHGKCLNAENFVNHVSSAVFRETVGRCTTAAEREECLWAAFCRRVVTEEEILSEVRTIASNAGNDVNNDWRQFCQQITSQWNGRFGRHGSPLTVDDFASRTGELVRTHLNQAIRQAATAGRQIALGETIGNIGQSALLLLPLVRFGKVGLAIGVPVFVVLAGGHLWNHVLSRLDNRPNDLQRSVSAQLAALGRDVGDAFEQEVRHRLQDLHKWQEDAIQEMANRLVDERVGIF